MIIKTLSCEATYSAYPFFCDIFALYVDKLYVIVCEVSSWSFVALVDSSNLSNAVILWRL